MKVKVNGFACDQCDKFAESNDDFITVNRKDLIAEVCGTECLVKMARELLAAERRVLQEQAAEVGDRATAGGYTADVGRPPVPSDDQIDQARARLNGNDNGKAPKVSCSVCGKEVSEDYIGTHLRIQHEIRGGRTGRPRATARRFPSSPDFDPERADAPSAS